MRIAKVTVYQMETAEHPLKRRYSSSLQETILCYKHTNMYDNKPIKPICGGRAYVWENG